MFHLKKKQQICGPQMNQKQMLAFGHLQGMQLLKNCDEFQYVHIGCTNIINVVLKHLKMNLNQMFIGQTTSSLP
jgi:hypothetical protein